MNIPGPRKAVAFVEGTMIGAGEHCVRAATELGLVPVFVTKEPEIYPFLDRCPCEVVEVTTADDGDILDALSCVSNERNLEIVGVGTTSDNMLLPVLAAAKTLGLEHPCPASIRNCKDKSATRRLLPDQSPAFRSVSSARDLDDCRGLFTGETIVKPTSLNSGLGVRRCRSWADTKRHVEHLWEVGLVPEGDGTQQVLVEEYVSGQEFSVEVFDGVALGVTQVEIDDSMGFIEVSHLHPAACEPELDSMLAASAEEAVRRTGLIWGPAHVQYRWNGTHARLIEINPRLGGGNVTQCVEHSRGVRLAHAYVKRICRLPGVGDELRVSNDKWAVVRFVLSRTSEPVSEVTGLEDAGRADCVVEVGTRARTGERYAVKGSNHDRLAFAIASANNAEDAIAAARVAVEHISIETQEG